MDIITGRAPPSHESIHNNPRRVRSWHGLENHPGYVDGSKIKPKSRIPGRVSHRSLWSGILSTFAVLDPMPGSLHGCGWEGGSAWDGGLRSGVRGGMSGSPTPAQQPAQ